MAVVLADSVAIGEDALEAIEVEIEPLPAVADWHASRSRTRACCSRRPAPTARSTFTAVRGDADAAFAKAPYMRRETLPRQRHYGLTMEPRGLLAEWDAAKGRLTVLGRGQGAVLQPPHPGQADRAAGRRDRHDRERRRRRLRRARRVLSGGFPDPVRGAPSSTGR